MLTLDEGRGIFKALQICSSCGILPVEVVLKDDVILKQGNRIRSAAYSLTFAFHFFCAIYQTVRLVQVLVGSRILVPSHFPIHVATWAAVCISSFWSWQAFIKYPDYMLNLFNETFAGSPGFGSSRRRPLVRMDLQELIAILMPFVIVSMGLTVFVANVLEPDKVHLISDLVPDKYRTLHVILICHALDVYVMVINGAVCLFIISIHGLLSQNMNYKLETHLKKLNKSHGPNGPATKQRLGRTRAACLCNVRDTIKQLSRIVLLVSFFNSSNANIIYAFKTASFTVPILLYYFTIRHFGSNVIVDIFGFWCGSAVLVIFSLIYDKAFKIPENIANLKQLMKLCTLMTHMPRGTQMELVRLIRSMRAVGIREGEFGVLERTSTPKILNFTLFNTCNLLVS